MNIIACVKIVPEEQDIVVNSDHTLNFDKAASKISLYDLNALEAAANLAEKGDKVVALSVGGQRLANTKVHKDVLSRGADELVLVNDATLEAALPETTAKVLAAAASKTGFDLMLCGEGSSDLYAQITGILAAEHLNVPVINYVSKITRNGNTVTVERALDAEVEELSVQLPAVLCVSSDINNPRIPSVKAILQAGKKPATTMSLADTGASAAGTTSSVMLSILASQQKERQKNIIEGDSDDKIAAFAENVRKALQ